VEGMPVSVRRGEPTNFFHKSERLSEGHLPFRSQKASPNDPAERRYQKQESLIEKRGAPGRLIRSFGTKEEHGTLWERGWGRSTIGITAEDRGESRGGGKLNSSHEGKHGRK